MSIIEPSRPMASPLRTRVHRWFSRLHKWVGLLIGLQLLFWTAGGVVMSWLPIEEVRGEHKIAAARPAPTLTPDRLAALAANPALGQATRIDTLWLADRPAIHLNSEQGLPKLLDMETGAAIEIDEGMAGQIAARDLSIDAAIDRVRLIRETPPIEYRGPLPVWRVDFNDPDATSLYVSPSTGAVVSRRSDTWRFYDFFWMLHIMDYDGRDDFNNPLIMIAALTAMLFTLTGGALLYFRLRL